MFVTFLFKWVRNPLDPNLKTHVLTVELRELFDDKTIRVSTVASGQAREELLQLDENVADLLDDVVYGVVDSFPSAPSGAGRPASALVHSTRSNTSSVGTVEGKRVLAKLGVDAGDLVDQVLLGVSDGYPDSSRRSSAPQTPLSQRHCLQGTRLNPGQSQMQGQRATRLKSCVGMRRWHLRTSLPGTICRGMVSESKRRTKAANKACKRWWGIQSQRQPRSVLHREASCRCMRSSRWWCLRRLMQKC